MTKDRFMKEMHETAKGMYEIGVMDEQTMREFDALCLPKIKNYTSSQITRIRKRNKVSQAVFAIFLNTSKSTVQKWEQGQKKPSGLALKLLSLVDRHGIKILME